jgi:hypothetical protein
VQHIGLVFAILLACGCRNEVEPTATLDSPLTEAKPDSDVVTGKFTPESHEIPLSVQRGRAKVTVEGILKGCWMRQQSGNFLGQHSKMTMLDPLRLVVGTRSLPLVGMTEDMEHALLGNSGKRVRLKGELVTWNEDGRGHQNPQAGYTGPIPAHVVEFLTVHELEVIDP